MSAQQPATSEKAAGSVSTDDRVAMLEKKLASMEKSMGHGGMMNHGNMMGQNGMMCMMETKWE